ncbi:unnamed protein product [Strongylus vulgaris]|uniref:Uncharacterized protein n=1 Tax=Strongylus vulgaris TaxID=40348 RepID=A0A3P7IUV7_STRVU|nr:unnamed protein product [Strongylus vulgaris]
MAPSLTLDRADSVDLTKRKGVNGDSGQVSAKRPRRSKQRSLAPDAELGYNNGCVVEEYKGFSNKYTEPVILVTYKEPLPVGFENRQDEIVPVRIVAEKDPQGSHPYLAGPFSIPLFDKLLSVSSGNKNEVISVPLLRVAARHQLNKSYVFF